LTTDSFSSFYSAIHGHRPFVWQQELLKKVVAEGWPVTIAVPTSSGKTSAIDVAVFHLALEAGKGALERRSSLRTFFIVDRRVVVDEAFDHAEKIANRLRDATDGAVKEVADQLNVFGGKLPLQVSKMRGGMLRDNAWVDEPNQPTVCLSTVDQVGSRLLFRGYQVGERSRSVHAGLIGNDSLLILDEAHLSNAFHQTLQSVTAKYSRWAENIPARPPTVVKMSGTTIGEAVFGLKEEWIERDAEVLGARLRASKPAELRDAKRNFEHEMATAAMELASEIKAGVVGVIANTVGSAREIFNKLNGEKVLLIGRNRPWCTEQLWREYKDRIAARPERERTGLLHVVATQTVEVGANLDFDALVSEAAPLDSLRQRFGRLNRLGRDGEAKAIIVIRRKADLVYGEATNLAWGFLNARKPVDFGVMAMNVLLEDVNVQPLKSKASEAPLLFPAHLEWWAQTSPAPDPSPDVAPFLHGPNATDAADVQIVWREDLLPDNKREWGDLVELMPPVQREALAMPLGSVRRWLKEQEQDIADVEGLDLAAPKDEKREALKMVVLWRSGEAKTANANNLRPGDSIVVPSFYGGADQFGWNPRESFTTDVADAVNADEAEKGLRRRCIRLDVAIKTDSELAALVAQFRTERDQLVEAAILERLGLPTKGSKVDSTGRIVRCPLKPPNQSIEPLSEEKDETDDSSLTTWESLASHTAGVVEHAKKYASGCGIAAELSRDICLAARLHDWGKCDERFQSWLAGKPFCGGKHLAKSGDNRSKADDATLRAAAGYPNNARHEAASVMAACASGLLSKAHDRDLVLHLIGTHHGFGRPFFPVWDDQPGFTVLVEAEGRSFETSSGKELARIDSGWVDRFSLLNRRYGYWGLAYLEAILRRADCMQSRKEEQIAPTKTHTA
jgi:CRISPR-associated endonuclease/helicase Cas3